MIILNLFSEAAGRIKEEVMDLLNGGEELPSNNIHGVFVRVMENPVL